MTRPHRDPAHNVLDTQVERWSRQTLKLLNRRDPTTAAHVERVAALTDGLCRHLGVSDEDRALITTAALHHDDGKLFIGSPLTKPGRLDDGEYAQMRRHDRLGEASFGPAPLPDATAGGSTARTRRIGDQHEIEVAFAGCPDPGLRGYLMAAALDHHERWDGGDRPGGRKSNRNQRGDEHGGRRHSGEQVSWTGRALAVADVYEALTSTERPYREPESPEKVLHEILDSTADLPRANRPQRGDGADSPGRGAGAPAKSGQFDPVLGRAFVAMVAEERAAEMNPASLSRFREAGQAAENEIARRRHTLDRTVARAREADGDDGRPVRRVLHQAVKDPVMAAHVHRRHPNEARALRAHNAQQRLQRAERARAPTAVADPPARASRAPQVGDA